MMSGLTATDKNRSQDITRLMKNLLVQYFVKQEKEVNHEILRENI